MASLTSPGRLRSLVVITGMSGSGKQTVVRAFEDLGYFCVDNLPISLIPRLIQMSDASGGEIQQLGIVVDIRLGDLLAQFEEMFLEIRQLSTEAKLIFLDASEEVLARRFSETRRVHPLAQSTSLVEGIHLEREKLEAIKGLADLVIDTTEFSVHDLRKVIYDKFKQASVADGLNISLVSFGFKRGVPLNSDLVFDVRFLPNPNFISELKDRTGKDLEVMEYMRGQADTEESISRFWDMLKYLLPRYSREGKKYLTVSIGCTGGRHRSVMIVEALVSHFEKEGQRVSVIHRDLHCK